MIVNIIAEHKSTNKIYGTIGLLVSFLQYYEFGNNVGKISREAQLENSKELFFLNPVVFYTTRI